MAVNALRCNIGPVSPQLLQQLLEMVEPGIVDDDLAAALGTGPDLDRGAQPPGYLLLQAHKIPVDPCLAPGALTSLQAGSECFGLACLLYTSPSPRDA